MLLLFLGIILEEEILISLSFLFVFVEVQQLLLLLLLNERDQFIELIENLRFDKHHQKYYYYYHFHYYQSELH